jgi:hypothetical protein
MPDDVVQDNMIQVRFQPANNPDKGVFKVMTEREVDARFGGAWQSMGVSTTLVASVFQVMVHHWVRKDSVLEAWYVTVHPAF